MAESLSHKFGQIIGDLLELALEPHLQKFAKNHKLYLDKKGVRKGRTGKKVSWFDGNDNKHDLDFVLERGATDDTVGIPVAFIDQHGDDILNIQETRYKKSKVQFCL